MNKQEGIKSITGQSRYCISPLKLSYAIVTKKANLSDLQ